MNPARSPVPLFADEHTEEEWETYLDQRRIGVYPDIAARAIGLTGSRMRAFLHREPERARQADEADAEGQQHYNERLQSTIRVIALDTQNPNIRALEVELATRVPIYGHLRRDRVKHEGHITHGITLALEPGWQDSWPEEKLAALREALALLDGEVVEGEAIELRQLPAA